MKIPWPAEPEKCTRCGDKVTEPAHTHELYDGKLCDKCYDAACNAEDRGSVI